MLMRRGNAIDLRNDSICTDLSCLPYFFLVSGVDKTHHTYVRLHRLCSTTRGMNPVALPGMQMKCNTTDEGGEEGRKEEGRQSFTGYTMGAHTKRRYKLTIRSNTGVETQTNRNTCLVSRQVWSKVVDPKDTGVQVKMDCKYSRTQGYKYERCFVYVRSSAASYGHVRYASLVYYLLWLPLSLSNANL